MATNPPLVAVFNQDHVRAIGASPKHERLILEAAFRNETSAILSYGQKKIAQVVRDRLHDSGFFVERVRQTKISEDVYEFSFKVSWS